jgi:hypothetical protein
VGERKSFPSFFSKNLQSIKIYFINELVELVELVERNNPVPKVFGRGQYCLITPATAVKTQCVFPSFWEGYTTYGVVKRVMRHWWTHENT